MHGMGGVGKTQLATEYAYAHASDYDLVWWIAAEEPASIPDQFAALAGRLGLDPAADPEALRGLVHDELRGVPGWLLIFDNADEADGHPAVAAGRAAAGRDPRACDRHDPAGRVQRAGAGAGPGRDRPAGRGAAAAHPGPRPGPGDRRADRRGARAAAAGAGAGRRLPGPLPDARPRSTWSCCAAAPLTCTRRGQVSCRTDTIATLWDISLDRITRENPAAVQLLGVCAYLAPEPVPLDLFTAHADLLPEPLSSAAADRLAFSDAIAVLVDYSLAKRTPAGLQLHRLVQATIRARDSRPARPPATRQGKPPMP